MLTGESVLVPRRPLLSVMPLAKHFQYLIPLKGVKISALQVLDKLLENLSSPVKMNFTVLYPRISKLFKFKRCKRFFNGFSVTLFEQSIICLWGLKFIVKYLFKFIIDTWLKWVYITYRNTVTPIVYCKWGRQRANTHPLTLQGS